MILESLSLQPQPQVAKNFADFAQNQYGPTLSKLFLLNYTQKLWGANADFLSTGVAGGRLKGLDLKTFIRESFFGPEKSTKHIDGKFLYPRYGFGMIVDKLTEFVSLRHIETNCRVTKIQHRKRKIESINKYRILEVNFDEFVKDLNPEKEQLKFSDLELIFKDLKNLFERRGLIINWKALENQSLNETINALAMASPFTLEEKQVLLETKNLDARKSKIADILTTYTFDQFNNTTIQ